MAFSDLTTARLLLRPLAADDAAAVFRYRSDPAVSRYQSWEPACLADVSAFIDRSSRARAGYAGELVSTGDMPPPLGRHHRRLRPAFPAAGGRQAEIGITVAPAHQGMGYATEALNVVLGYLFERLGKHRVYASVDPGNQPSIGLLERVGMRKEAHFRESIWFKDRWADDVVYALLEKEWHELKPGAARRSVGEGSSGSE